MVPHLCSFPGWNVMLFGKMPIDNQRYGLFEFFSRRVVITVLLFPLSLYLMLFHSTQTDMVFNYRIESMAKGGLYRYNELGSLYVAFFLAQLI